MQDGITIDEQGKRRFRMTLDPGRLGTKGSALGGGLCPAISTVELGAHLIMDDTGKVQAFPKGQLVGKVTVVSCEGLALCIFTGGRAYRLIFATPEMADQVQNEIVMYLQ